MPFPFAHFVLYLFTVINLSYVHSVLSPVSPPSKLLKRWGGGVLGRPPPNTLLIAALLKIFLGEERGLKNELGASLVVQWLRVCLPMQGTQVQEDPTCCEATEPVCLNY